MQNQQTSLFQGILVVVASLTNRLRSADFWNGLWRSRRTYHGRTLCTMCTCEEIERGTHAHRASKLGPVEWWWTQDGKMGITIQDPRQTPEDTGWQNYCILLICIAFCHVSKSLLVLRHCEHLFLFSMLILHVTSSRFCLYLLNIYHFISTFSHAHTEAHTHKHTYILSTHLINVTFITLQEIV